MTTAKKSLSSLGKLSSSFSQKNSENPSLAAVFEIDIELLSEDPANVRTKYDDSSLEAFADVLKTCGMSTPIAVREDINNKGKYIINNGHRRFRSAKIAGLKQVPVTLSNQHNLLMQLSDNVVREDLDLLDTAEAIERIVNAEDPAERRTREEVAKGIAKSPTWVSKVLKVKTMPDKIRFYYDLGRLKDLEAIYQLCVNYSKYALEISNWIEQYKESSELITQTAVNAFIKGLKNKEIPQIQEEPKETPKKEVLPTARPVPDESELEDMAGDIKPACFDEDLSPKSNAGSEQSVHFENEPDEHDQEDEESSLPTKENDQPHKTENIPLPVMVESDLQNGVDPTTPFDNADSNLTFSFEIKGNTLDESVSISQQIEKFIADNFSNKVIFKANS
ncbi:hypothetical protein L292_3162 [Acinetobacter junii CIP 107470 = MTCC 11364]|uniref:ParB-like N-terminal domain-containing protein n=1 Tax=Acinetobacter junii CIP 107470 = MTCC 11364 TaxID=1217666 RepID=S7WV49_ACIJU|nr:ParB/RepB/Spo0J family partition protein [Acinetobacter junii]ENV52042.1 hypothetical protein F953_00532 [Acinetobacter junii CIP 107470 = MTCC 11364]EPR85832.1 hypothetical protein L292_3162 [Acinetobacter junii CIP 107470 = MTCC 11364]